MATPPAYVLRLGPSGLMVVRALGRRGVPVVAFHSDPQDPAARSRYARTRILPPIPGKPFQYRVAVEAGLPVPRTFFPRNEEEVLGAAVALGFPCVLKPAYSHQWQAIYGWEKLACVTTADEVLARWRDATVKGLSVVLQEYIPGGDDQFYVAHSYLDRGSRPLATGVVKKIRQYPPHFGASCVSMSVADPGIAEPIKKMGLAMLQAMKFHGIGGVEFKRHERTGELKLIEVNVRPGTMTAVVIDGGLNLPFIAYCDLLGQPAPLSGPFRGGRKVVLIGRDVKSFRYYRGRGELTWWQWGRSLLGRTREYYFGWDDPAPFIGQVRRLVRGAVG